MLKYIVDGTEPQKFFSWTFVSHKFILWDKFFFLKWGDDTVQAHTSNPFLYKCDPYVLITVQITVYDS